MAVGFFFCGFHYFVCAISFLADASNLTSIDEDAVTEMLVKLYVYALLALPDFWQISLFTKMTHANMFLEAYCMTSVLVFSAAGGYKAKLTAVTDVLETPPRAWGIRCFDISGHSNCGNTPTGVGNTNPRVSPQIDAWKHPHGRGEYFDTACHCKSDMETPPRAWGIRTRIKL